MAVATAMSRSHSWGMIKSRFAFYSSWFLLHLEQAEFMLRYQQTWQQHSWGRGPMPRRRALLYGAVRNRETARYSLFWCFTWRSSRRGCIIHLCHFAATSLVTDPDKPDNPKLLVVPRMFKVKRRDQRTWRATISSKATKPIWYEHILTTVVVTSLRNLFVLFWIDCRVLWTVLSPRDQSVTKWWQYGSWRHSSPSG